MSKIDKQAAKKLVLRMMPRLLPVGALFLPLGTLTFSLGALGEALGLGDLSGLLGGLLGNPGEGNSSTGTSYNIVGLIKALTENQESDLFKNLLKAEFMAEALTWIIVTAVGLGLSILFMLAGFGLTFSDKRKVLIASAAVYGVGTLGGICALVGFTQFSVALGPALINLATAKLEFGAWVMAAMLLLNLIVCLAQWRSIKQQERLAALAKKQRKKK